MLPELNPQGYAPDGTAILGNDGQLLVKFFNHPQISKYKSDQGGMPVYDNVEMISVIQPGEKEPTQVLANDWHRARFPKQYENFRKGIDQPADGTPLDHLFPSEPGTVMTLKAVNVFTIQQLATIPDSAISNLPMGRTLVDRAKAYLSTATGGSQFHQMQAEIEALKLQIANMAEATAAPAEPVRRGPGRPPKAAGE